MKKIPFVKYTMHGNNFVIVDEIDKSLLTESEKFRFAYQATNMNYGVGSDNFLVIQPWASETLEEIKDFRNYWKMFPSLGADEAGSGDAEYIFRMFEPDGKEAFSCGNGLICISDYLYQKYDVESARMMTEIPTRSPKAVTIGTDSKEELNWANMGPPRISSNTNTVLSHKIEPIDIQIKLPENGLSNSEKEISMKFSGYLVFTGEPHLVIFTELGFSPAKMASLIFDSSSMRDSGALLNKIGRSLNEDTQRFPEGININFVRLNSGVLEYRTFERGINHETQACGTGAVAVSFVAKHLNLISTDKITIWPYLSRRHNPNAQICVRKDKDDYILYGKPSLLFDGNFFVEEG